MVADGRAAGDGRLTLHVEINTAGHRSQPYYRFRGQR
jgi:hypothetical protein